MAYPFTKNLIKAVIRCSMNFMRSPFCECVKFCKPLHVAFHIHAGVITVAIWVFTLAVKNTVTKAHAERFGGVFMCCHVG